jgi:hypothetical protein
VRSMFMKVGIVLASAGAIALAKAAIPRWLSGMEVFRVRGVRLEGARFLTLEDALRSLALPPGASVWDDADPWIEPLLGHPLVVAVTVERNLPDSVILHVTETQPVALVPTPTLEPVDAGGRPLPIDPSRHRLDLPVLRVGAVNGGAVDPGRVRLLAHELDRLGSADHSFVAELSELAWDGRGDVLARWGEAGLAIRFRPPLGADRLRRALAVLGDATTRFPDRRPMAVDLRFQEQVVIRF